MLDRLSARSQVILNCRYSYFLVVYCYALDTREVFRRVSWKERFPAVVQNIKVY